MMTHTLLLQDNHYLTDAGLETTMVFDKNFELPHFASFTLLNNPEGIAALKAYYVHYLELAKKYNKNFIIETPTWRASSDWGALMGLDESALDAVNKQAVQLMEEIRAPYVDCIENILISGCLGPRSDGYQPSQFMTAEQAMTYHQKQIGSLAQAGVDMISVMTLGYPEEAIGMVKAAQQHKVPISISFTVETDGCLINGMSIEEAINCVDQATHNGPEYYMINCAHPDHFSDNINASPAWKQRIQGIRANASRLSHAELDNCEVLDSGNPAEWGQCYQSLLNELPNLKVLGGCCGTNHVHIEAICAHL